MKTDDHKDDPISRIAEAVRSVDPETFLFHARECVRVAIPTSKQEWQGHLADTPESHFEKMESESSALLEGTENLLKALTDFQPRQNGTAVKKKLRKKSEKARFCFGELRRHQKLLLTGIAHDTKMIRDLLRESGKMRESFAGHRKLLEVGEYLTEVIRERVSRQSIPRLDMPRRKEDEGGGGQEDLAIPREGVPAVPQPGEITLALPRQKEVDASQIGETIRDMRAYEEMGGEKLNAARSEKNVPAEAAALYAGILGHTRNAVGRTEKHLTEHICELRESWAFSEKLLTEGYSRKREKKFKALMKKHKNREDRFREAIRKRRAEHFQEQYLRVSPFEEETG